MARVPLSAAVLTGAGALPFLWGALLHLGVVDGFAELFGRDGRLLMIRYGGIILCFMAGVLWGFATKATGARAAMGYALSVVPTLWWFFFPGTGPTSALMNLAFGFIGVLALDAAFQAWGLAPRWWLTLRVPVSVLVLACLAVGIWA